MPAGISICNDQVSIFRPTSSFRFEHHNSLDRNDLLILVARIDERFVLPLTGYHVPRERLYAVHLPRAMAKRAAVLGAHYVCTCIPDSDKDRSRLPPELPVCRKKRRREKESTLTSDN